MASTAPQPERTPDHGYITSKARHLDRLKGIEGQVRGVQRMVEGDQYSSTSLPKSARRRARCKPSHLACSTTTSSTA